MLEPARWPTRARLTSARASRLRFRVARVPSGPLWKDQYEKEDNRGEDCRSDGAAHGEPALGHRLVEPVAHGCTQRSRQNEGRPEEEHTRDLRREIKDRQHGKPRAEYESTS